MAIYSLGNRTPKIHPEAFVHPDATLIGDVTIGMHSTIWPRAVLRGDYGAIIIGDATSIQDGTVIHATAELNTIVGSRCVVGHIAHLEGCTVQDDSLIGSGSVVLHRAIVQPHALVGANAVVTNDMIIPSFSMALGIPAKIFRDRVSKGQFQKSAESYVQNGIRYRNELRRLD